MHEYFDQEQQQSLHPKKIWGQLTIFCPFVLGRIVYGCLIQTDQLWFRFSLI